MSDVADALRRIESPGHDLEQAFSACYPELKKIARARLRGSGLQGEMQTTALVHDSYLRLASRKDLAFPDRIQFFAYASRVLRSIVIDLVREQRAQRRGGDADIVTLDTAIGEGLAPATDLEQVNTYYLPRIYEVKRRLAGKEVVSFEDKEASFADIYARIDRTLDLLAAAKASEIDGSEGRDITITPGGRELKFKGQDYLVHWVMPNFFFHVTATYAILRHNGVEVGKMDYLGSF